MKVLQNHQSTPVRLVSNVSDVLKPYALCEKQKKQKLNVKST